MTLQITNPPPVVFPLRNFLAVTWEWLSRREKATPCLDLPASDRARLDLGLNPRQISPRDALDCHLSNIPVR